VKKTPPQAKGFTRVPQVEIALEAGGNRTSQVANEPAAELSKFKKW